MKTLKYSFGLLLSLIAMISISSCEEFETVTPDIFEEETAGGEPKIFFSNQLAQQIDLADDSKSFDVEVSRTVAAEAAVYNINVTADSAANAVFEFPATVEFADSATTATYTVSVKEGVTLEYEVYYNITLAVDEADSTPYGNATYEFAVGIPAPWSEWELFGKGTFTLGIYWSGTHSELPIYYREYLLNDTDAQFYIPGIANSMNLTIEYNRQTGACQILPQYATTNSNYGQVTITDIPHYPFTNLTGTYEDYPCYFDAEKGLFTFNVAYIVCTLWDANTNGSFGNGVETFQLDGFKQYDYSFSMNFKGQYIDASGTANAVISTTVGADVSQYLMTVVAADTDLNATVAGMLDGTVACDTLTEAGFYAYPMTESGVYTALAITFDAEGNALEAYTSEFEFWLAGQENPWQSLGMATYTEDCMTTFFNVENLSYQVEVREHKEMPGLFRIINPYGAAYPYNAEGDYDASKEYYIEIDARDPEGVYIPGVYGTGMDWSYGEVSITSMVYYYMATQGATLEDCKDAGVCGILADGVITFPANGLLISMAEYRDGNFFSSNVNGLWTLDMSNMTPAGAAAAKAPAARISTERELNNVENGVNFPVRFKKIDNSFMTPVNAELK